MGSRTAARWTFLILIGAGLVCAASSFACGASPQRKTKLPNEKNPQYQCEKGIIALRYGLTDEAIRYGQLAVSLDPNHVNSWNLLGSAYYTKGEYRLSAEAFERSLTLKPGTAEIYRNLGLSYVELKENAKAFEVLSKSFALAGDDESAYQLGKLYYAEKRYEEALDYALKSIQKNPRNARAYNLKGVVLNQLGRPLEAAGSFQAGLVLSPEDIGLQVNLGIAYLNANEPAKAKAVLEAVLPKIQEEVLRKQVEGLLQSIKDDRF